MISGLKSMIKAILHMFLYKVRKPININESYRIYGDEGHHTFIGYYDIHPFDPQDKLLLAGRCRSDHNGRAMDVRLDLGVIDLASGDFKCFDQTPLWCWQQGCRLQWQSFQGKVQIAYNTLQDGRAICAFYDIEVGRRSAALPFPVYCFTQDGGLAATLDFNDLQMCRPGYGYDYQSLSEAAPRNPYIRIYDTGKTELRAEIHVPDILTINPHPSMHEDGCLHYFNHLHFNPSGTRLMVFHIWEVQNKRRVRALTMAPDGTDIRDVTKGVHVSHYWWLDDDQLLFYATDTDHGIGYHIYNQDGSGRIESFGHYVPQIDGHPSTHPANKSLVVSDTVQDRLYRRGLWLYDIGRRKKCDLGYLHSVDWLSGEQRCDLHPRWSSTGRYIAIDSGHNGYRQIVVVEPKQR